MKKKIIRAIKSDLVKTSFFNGVANAIRILTSLISNKISAVYLGPTGVALVGQFNDFATMAMSMGTLGISSGVTKFTAEYYDNEVQRKKIISTGFYLVVVPTVFIAFFVYMGRFYFSDVLLHSRAYVFAFTALAATLLFFSLNTFLIAVLNGYKEFKKIVITNITTSLAGLAIAVFLVVRYKLNGALLGIVLSQTLVFFVSLTLVAGSSWFKRENFLSYFDTHSFKQLFKFSLMAFTSIFAVTFVQLQIRNFIINTVSIEDAGYWQGITRLSDIYLSFITATLSIYYLPRLSEIKEKVELKKEVLRVYKFILPLAIISSLVIYMSRTFIINILFSPKFSPMESLFRFQFLGNIFKIASWLLGYIMIAKAMFRTYIVFEIIFGISFYVLSISCVTRFGIVGVSYSYALNYLIYLIAIIYIFRHPFFLKEYAL